MERLKPYLEEVGEYLKERGFGLHSVFVFDSRRVCAMILKARRTKKKLEYKIVRCEDPFRCKELKGFCL